MKKESGILELISDIYIFVLIVIYPLIVDSTGYFHIMECKWYSFLIISVAYIFAIIITILYFWIFKDVKYFKSKKLSIIQWLAISFLLINILSCVFSPYISKYNLFIGIGRGEGLLMTSLYIITFLFITFFAKFKKRYLLYFSISSILISFVAILQYVGFNPFNLYQNGIGTHNVSFMTTIGNKDFISAVYCIFLAVSFASFVFIEDAKYNKIIHFLSVFLGSFVICIINVLSGKVAFLFTILILIPFIICNNKRLSRFLLLFASMLLTYCINVIINPEYHYSTQKLGLYWQINYLVILFIVVFSLLIYLAIRMSKLKYNYSNLKKMMKYCYWGEIFFIILIIVVLYFYNFSSGTLYEIHGMLHGNFADDFGSYRMFLWKRAIKLFSEYPILGTGPDTFVVRFMSKYTADIAAIGSLTLNDTAGCVYLTMLINIGIIGLINYLLFIFYFMKNGLTKAGNYSYILLISIICFLVQDCFNLSVVIVTPIFWLLLGLFYVSFDQKGLTNNNKKTILKVE